MPLNEKLAAWKTKEAKKKSPGKYRLAKLVDRHVKSDTDAGNLSQYLCDTLDLDEDEDSDDEGGE